MPNSEDIEIRSEEVQEILTKVPHWLIRYGISVILVLILGLLLTSWFIKYPDTIVGKALISTESPPIYVGSFVSGRIDKVSVESGDLVKKDQILATINNPIPLSTIEFLKSVLGNIKSIRSNQRGYCSVVNLEAADLYEATGDYLSLKNVLKELCNFQNDEYAKGKLTSLKVKLKNNQRIAVINEKQIELGKIDFSHAKEKFQMHEEEFKDGLSIKLDFINAQSTYNQALKAQEVLRKSQVQLEMTLNDYNRQILDFVHERQEEEKRLKETLDETLERLENYILEWSNNFALKSPLEGHVSFLDRLLENQQVTAGANLLAIIPEESEYVVILDLPIQGFGKIKAGQEVKIKVDNFPDQEFGTINGIISSIPSLPKNDVYRVKVTLPNGLTTSYDKELVYQPEMTAQAEVITEDLRLIERFFYQIRSIFN